ncbi:MAG TPA: DUF1772 domain-containing protein [Verrucomicrobiota bacterium]|nr:DUF1772 domain-containing protein [Verrucomicrobiota bacterium]
MEEFKTALGLGADIARFLSAASLGIFAGGMLTEGCLLVPIWRSLAPSEFFSWYATNGRRLQDFFGPLTTVAGLLALLAALLSFWEGHSGRWLSVLAALISVAVVSTFFLYFQRANKSFSEASLSVEGLPAELARWATWHWWRTGLSIVALVVALRSL